MPRSEKEVQEQIQGLRAILKNPTFRRVTFFGDSNEKAIQAQIETLERRFTVDTVDCRDGEEWTEHSADSAREAAYWLAGDVEDTPAGSWTGLYTPPTAAKKEQQTEKTKKSGKTRKGA